MQKGVSIQYTAKMRFVKHVPPKERTAGVRAETFEKTISGSR